MPASYLMSWEPRSRRWWKQYKGKRYVVSCRQLGVPETKEGSYQAANAWWLARKTAIDSEQRAHPHSGAIAGLTQRRDWLARHGDHEERELYDAEIARVTGLGEKAAPKNLHGRRYRFGQTAKEIETFAPDEVRRLVEGATGQLKLYLLLMLNCGFYQSDISDLRHEEVDLERGYVTRRRSKRRHHGDKVPTVSYRLWPCTLALLRQYSAEDPALALTTREGKSWVAENVQRNRLKSRRDGIKSNFVHLQRRLEITKPLKSFRKASASMLDKHGEFSRYAQFFLGHAGRTVAEKHYVKPDQEQFDSAVDWLRLQYGF